MQPRVYQLLKSEADYGRKRWMRNPAAFSNCKYDHLDTLRIKLIEESLELQIHHDIFPRLCRTPYKLVVSLLSCILSLEPLTSHHSPITIHKSVSVSVLSLCQSVCKNFCNFCPFFLDFCLKFGIILTLYSCSAGWTVCWPAGTRYSGEPHVFVSADTRQKSIICQAKQGFEHLNLCNLDLFRI